MFLLPKVFLGGFFCRSKFIEPLPLMQMSIKPNIRVRYYGFDCIVVICKLDGQDAMCTCLEGRIEIHLETKTRTMLYLIHVHVCMFGFKEIYLIHMFVYLKEIHLQGQLLHQTICNL